eukprot:423431-Lingulodinium_polyedra.AAC.1
MRAPICGALLCRCMPERNAHSSRAPLLAHARVERAFLAVACPHGGVTQIGPRGRVTKTLQLHDCALALARHDRADAWQRAPRTLRARQELARARSA